MHGGLKYRGVSGQKAGTRASIANSEVEQLLTKSQQLNLQTPPNLQCALARKSGGRGAASGWIASDFLDSLFLSHQGERKINAGPHAVTSLSNTTGTLLPTTSQAVDYTAFNKASHIAQGGKDYFVTYGPDRQRRSMALDHQGVDNLVLSK
ncbi:MAG: hypothetical protein ACOCXH_15350, partial [Cyclobacteriaceae bacterium]